MKQERARKILGLDGKTAVRLFHAEGYPGDRSSVTTQQAVKTLRRPARTSPERIDQGSRVRPRTGQRRYQAKRAL